MVRTGSAPAEIWQMIFGQTRFGPNLNARTDMTQASDGRSVVKALRANGDDRTLAEKWVGDLGADIGSARWFRSLGLLVALIIVTFAFWPDFSALQAAAPSRLTQEERDEYRSQIITPLALGADSGRRMGPSRLVVPLANAPERPVVELTATMGKDDRLSAMLRRAGVSGNDAARVEELIGGSLPLDQIASGTSFDIRLGRRATPSQPRPLERLSFRARLDLELAVAREGGPLALERRVIRVDDTPLRITGTVGSGLYRAARAAGAPAKSVQQYLKALGDALDINREVGAGDTFDMIIAYSVPRRERSRSAMCFTPGWTAADRRARNCCAGARTTVSTMPMGKVNCAKG